MQTLHQQKLANMQSAFFAVSKHQTLQAFANKRPQLAEDIFVAPNSSMIGDVTLGKSSSVWYGAVLRGDCLFCYTMGARIITLSRLLQSNRSLVEPDLDVPAQHADCNAAGDVNSIKVGENSNIQDNVVVHVAKHNAQDRALPTIIGNNVTIGMLSSHAGLVPSEPADLHVCLLQASSIVLKWRLPCLIFDSPCCPLHCFAGGHEVYSSQLDCSIRSYMYACQLCLHH